MGLVRTTSGLPRRKGWNASRNHAFGPAHRDVRGRAGIAPSAALVVLLTWPIGVGMGLAGALVPVAVKENFPLRPAGPRASIQRECRSALLCPPAVAVPIALWYAGWRTSLIAFSRDDRDGGRLASAHKGGANPRAAQCRSASAPLAQPHRLVARRNLFVDGIHVLRHQRLAARFLRRAWLGRHSGRQSCSRLSTWSRSLQPSIVPWLSDRVGTRTPMASRHDAGSSSPECPASFLLPSSLCMGCRARPC
jgi:hypothetical protein